MTHPRLVTAVPLTKDNFLPFGDMMQLSLTTAETINYGAAQAQRELSHVQNDHDGHTRIGMYRAAPRTSPTPLALMEKHPLGSQAFMPLGGKPWLVAVATTTADGRVGDILARHVRGDTGINYHRHVWHYPLLTVAAQNFMVIDRGGAGDNLCEQIFSPSEVAWLFFDEAALGGPHDQIFANPPPAMSEDDFMRIFSPLLPGGAWVVAEIWRYHLSSCATVAGFHQAMAKVILTASAAQQRDIIDAEQLLPSLLPLSVAHEGGELLAQYRQKFGFPLAQVSDDSLITILRRRVAMNTALANVEWAESLMQIFRLARARLHSWANS